MTLTFGSLFSGIGGFDLGFERAGLQPIWQCENNKDCQRALKRHWPNTRLYNDVKEINRTNTTSPDVLVGGFPCQDLSIAGKREGLAGERSGLWFEFHRIIKELAPGWVVIENVPGLLSSNSGEDFAVVLRGLAECGYYAAWRVLDAQYFGVAQRRRRVFIVASLGNGSCAEILFESEGGAWDSPPGRETGERIAATITKRFGGASNQRPPINEADNLIPAIAQSNRGAASGQQAETLRADSHGAIPMVAHSVRPRSGMPQGWNSNLVAFSESGQGWWRDGIGTLRERDYKDGNTGLICNAFNGYTGGADDNDAQGNHLVTAWTVRGGCEGGGKGYLDGGDLGLTLGGQPQWVGVRRLTPIECERLQGFPDGFTDGQSDSARYRQLGNAIAVPCSEWIGQRIIATIAVA